MAGKVRFHQNVDRVMTIWGLRTKGTEKFGDWKENMACGKKTKVSSIY